MDTPQKAFAWITREKMVLAAYALAATAVVPAALPPLLGASFNAATIALGGSGRARAVWDILRRGADPFGPSGDALGGKARTALAAAYSSPVYELVSAICTWGPQGQGVRGVKTMVKSVGDRQIPRLESYGRM